MIAQLVRGQVDTDGNIPIGIILPAGDRAAHISHDGLEQDVRDAHFLTQRNEFRGRYDGPIGPNPARECFDPGDLSRFQAKLWLEPGNDVPVIHRSPEFGFHVELGLRPMQHFPVVVGDAALQLAHRPVQSGFGCAEYRFRIEAVQRVPGNTDARLEKDIATVDEERFLDDGDDSLDDLLELLPVPDPRDQAGELVGAEPADDPLLLCVEIEAKLFKPPPDRVQ